MLFQNTPYLFFANVEQYEYDKTIMKIAKRREKAETTDAFVRGKTLPTTTSIEVLDSMDMAMKNSKKTYWTNI